MANDDLDAARSLQSIDSGDTESSDPDSHIAEGYQYGRREIKGAKFQKWIDGDEGTECPVKPIQLTSDELVQSGAYENWKEKFDMKYTAHLHILDFDPRPFLGPGPNREFAKVSIKQKAPSEELDDEAAAWASLKLSRNRWTAYIGSGFICMSEMFRHRKEGDFSSEVFHAFYTRYYDIDTLSYCFVPTIINSNTITIVERLYKAKGYPMHCEAGADEDEVTQSRFWRYNTPEYKALLGTRIGGVVATLVLGAFPRGTSRIAYIRTSLQTPSIPGSATFGLSMKFHIAPI